jgi:hypothetical protein
MNIERIFEISPKSDVCLGLDMKVLRITTGLPEQEWNILHPAGSQSVDL